MLGTFFIPSIYKWHKYISDVPKWLWVAINWCSILAIVVGIIFNAIVVSIIMILFEIIFSIWLVVENKSLNNKI